MKIVISFNFDLPVTQGNKIMLWRCLLWGGSEQVVKMLVVGDSKWVWRCFLYGEFKLVWEGLGSCNP